MRKEKTSPIRAIVNCCEKNKPMYRQKDVTLSIAVLGKSYHSTRKWIGHLRCNLQTSLNAAMCVYVGVQTLAYPTCFFFIEKKRELISE